MGNGTMLNELRDLAKTDNIPTNAYRRLSLASQADIHEAVFGKNGLKERMDKAEKKITYLARAELIMTGVFGIIIAKIRGV